MEPKLIAKTGDAHKDGRVPIKLYCYISKPVFLSTNVSVRPAEWHRLQQKVIKRPDASELNLILQQHLSRANEILINARLEGITLTAQEFKDRFANPQLREDFIAFFQHSLYERYKANELSHGTFKKQKVTLDKLRRYTTRLPFASITPELLDKLDKWHIKQLQQESKRNGKPLVRQGQNTRNELLKNIRTYLNLARKRGIPAPYPFNGISLKFSHAERIYLEAWELQKLVDLYRAHHFAAQPMLGKVLRYFLFACFTGLRISDIQRFSADWIQGDELVFYPQKNRQHKKLHIPLTATAKEFLYREGGQVFETISSQKTNQSLKRIAHKANIDKALTFHVARHTFATMFLELGGAIETLQQLLGHADLSTTQIYAHITDKRKHIEMDNFNKHF
jgi:site-specific recombinase XerD